MQCVFKYTDFCEKIIWQTTKKHIISSTDNVFEVCARETGYEGGGLRRESVGAKRRYIKNLGSPWKTRGKLRGNGLVG